MQHASWLMLQSVLLLVALNFPMSYVCVFISLYENAQQLLLL